MTTVSIVSIENGITNYRIKFSKVTTVIINNFALFVVAKKIARYEDGHTVKDDVNDTEYRLDFDREVVTIVRDQEEDIEVAFHDFNTAVTDAAERSKKARAVSAIYGPKIFTEVILKAMEHGKTVLINDMSTFGYKILAYDGYAFEVAVSGTHHGRRFILHSHVSTIGIME